MNKALFLDRDGVINRESGSHTYELEKFIINPDVPQALKVASDKGYLLIVITNQSGIGLKMYTHEHVHVIHEHLISKLRENGVGLTEIYYCPHHPESGKCLCRKPGSLMLEKAIARFQIDASKSYFIGDRERDKIAGDKVGLNTILVKENSPLLPICSNLP